MSESRSARLVRWLVIWTCIIGNAVNVWLAVHVKTPALINVTILIVSFIPYMLYIRYRTPPI